MKKNMYLYITIGILLVFTIVYFVVANNISYAFSYSPEDIEYENRMLQFETISKKYAEDNPDLFKDKEVIYITVDDLAKKGLVLADEDGIVTNPKSEVTNFNDLKIRIKKNKDNFDVKILSQD